jgi:hypothetical protein
MVAGIHGRTWLMHDVYPNLSWGHWREDPQFPHSISKCKSLRLEYGYSGHHTETDHVIRSGSLDCRRVAIRPPQPRELEPRPGRKMWGVSGTEASSSDFSRVKRPFAFTNLTTRVVTHLKLPIMHQGQPDCAHVASVRARTGQHNTRVHSPPKLHTAQRYTEEIL